MFNSVVQTHIRVTRYRAFENLLQICMNILNLLFSRRTPCDFMKGLKNKPYMQCSDFFLYFKIN